MKREKLIVIGNGMAGMSCVDSLLRHEKKYDISVFGDETYVNYNRIGLSSMLAGEKEQDDLTLNSLEWYQENEINLFLGEKVEKIDREKKIVQAEGGRALPYDRLLIATGSVPFIPPIKGVDLPGVEVFRTLDDTKRLLREASFGGPAIVIGGGLLGLECARGLQVRGMSVTCIHLATHLMEMQLDGTGGRALLEGIRRLGIQVELEASTEAFLGNGHLEKVRLADGREFPASLAVVSCGIRPRVQLAKDCGLEVNRGIVVNNGLRTSDESIYAVGECVEHKGRVYGLVAPLYEQAKVAAANLAGESNAAYRGSEVATSLKVAGVDVFSAGVVEGDEGCESVRFEDMGRGVYKKLTIKNGVLVGAMLVGDSSDSLFYSDLIRSKKQLGELRETLLIGGPREEAEIDPAAMPDGKIVCGCIGVTKGRIVDAVANLGLKSLRDVKEATRASTGCGSCAGLVECLLKSAAGDKFEAAKKDVLCDCYDFSLMQLRSIAETQKIKSVSELAEVYGNNLDGCPSCKPALAYMMDELWCGDHEEERAHRFINDRVHANIQRDGTFSVVPRMRGGVTSPDELMKIVVVAKKYNVPMVKVTGSQRIDLLGVPKESLPKIWEELDMPCGHAFAKAVRMVKTCVGSTFCRFGTQDSIATGIELEKRLENLYTPAKVKLAVVGCPRNCAESTVKDIGLVGVDGGWQVVVGGAAGKSVREADLLCQVETREEALQAAMLFFQYYRENANYLERTYDFVERLGMKQIKADTIYGEQGAKDRLMERLRKSKEKSFDPWTEGKKPKTEYQFETIKAELLV